MITPAQILGLQHVIELAKATHSTVGSTFAQNPTVMESNAISLQHIGNAQDLLDMLSVTSGTDFFPSFFGTTNPDHEQIVLLYVPALSQKFILAKYIKEKSRICLANDLFADKEAWDAATETYFWPQGFYAYIHDAVPEYCWHHLGELFVERWWAIPKDLMPGHSANPSIYYRLPDWSEFGDIDLLTDAIKSDFDYLAFEEVQRRLNISLELPSSFFLNLPSDDPNGQIARFSDAESAATAVRELEQNRPEHD